MAAVQSSRGQRSATPTEMPLQLLMTNDSGHLSTSDTRRDWNADNGIIAMGWEIGMHA